jgi:hypothetical protein
MGEDAVTIPRVSLTIETSRISFTRPSVFISPQVGLATSSHQACRGFPATGSLRDVDGVCSASGGDVAEGILFFPFSAAVSDGPRGTSL